MDKADRDITAHSSDGKPFSEADHYLICPGCGALIDMRNIRMLLDHAGELPHGPGIIRS